MMRNLIPGERPTPNSLEAGLWMSVARAEKDLRTSGRLYHEKELRKYISGITCRLAGDYCSDIRVYVTHIPLFNASMYPNGMMNVWTGLLLRTRNEAQLAAVLGHEIGHYIRRHSVQRLENAQDVTGVLVFFQFAFAVAGIPGASEVASLIALASLSAYSRDHEREADRMGLELMAKAGYDPREAAALWRQLIDEKNADKDTSRAPVFFATHPSGEERVETLTKLANDVIAEFGSGKKKEAAFRKIMDKHRSVFLRDETYLQRFARANKLLEMLIDDGHAVGELKFFQGELRRVKGGKKDLGKALEFYEKAIGSGKHPAELYKYLGLVHRKLKNPDKARDAFNEYLRRAPDAEDRLMIEAIVNKMG